jgi:hypothetical protein
MENNLEKFNFLWKCNLTQEEYDKELVENPSLWTNYSIQQKVSKKYNGFVSAVNTINKLVQDSVDNGVTKVLRDANK